LLEATLQTIGTWWLWLIFFVFVSVVLAIDIIILNKKDAHRVSTKEALSWTLVWVICALFFNVLLWIHVNHLSGEVIANEKAFQFFTGYLIEETLSVDNMFAFILVFNYFAVPLEYQRRVLLFGVIGAVVMRFIMILFGSWLIAKLHWILYLFGAFLLITGIKMLFVSQDENTLENNFLLNWVEKHIRLVKEFHGEHFFIKKNHLWYATPLFLALVMIEFSDLVFALDSIPAIFAITTDPFIVFTSNIFAILGLRALYFLLLNASQQFHLLKYGVALILAFIGAKMLIEPWFHLSIQVALGIVVAVLATTIILSALSNKRKRYKTKEGYHGTRKDR
jgi:tellurite resistance protein TerC